MIYICMYLFGWCNAVKRLVALHLAAAGEILRELLLSMIGSSAMSAMHAVRRGDEVEVRSWLEGGGRVNYAHVCQNENGVVYGVDGLC